MCGLRLNTRIKAAVVAMLLLPLPVSAEYRYAQKITENENILFVINGDQCITFSRTDKKRFADDIPKPQSELFKYNWPVESQLAVDGCKQYIAGIWKTYSSRGYSTIPVYTISKDGTKGVKTDIRVKTGLECDKRIVKTISKNYQYRGIHINGSQKAVYCKRF